MPAIVVYVAMYVKKYLTVRGIGSAHCVTQAKISALRLVQLVIYGVLAGVAKDTV
jgi:hypothetical protein